MKSKGSMLCFLNKHPFNSFHANCRTLKPMGLVCYAETT
uniref:Uncharacterized protein n=1 Tax=Rhizophora mucronata TaxID=61149 RepID=A0A2P2NJZ9_RHIMU